MESYARQSISEEDIAAVAEALADPMITRGPRVEAFEMAIAEYCGAAHAVAFNSGTSAMTAAYAAAKTDSFDRIVTTPNTYIGTVTGGVQRGAQLHLLDIDLTTGNLQLDQIKELPRSPSRGKTIYVPVHYAGAPLDMIAFEREIKEPDDIIIEDAAHALGATYPTGKRVGSCERSDMTVFSFHPAKSITTGEGGMVLTNSAKLANRLRLFRNNGSLSGNFHLTDFQAALGLSQLKRLPTFLKKRRSLVKSYRRLLEGVTMLSDTSDANSAHHLFVVQVDNRDQVKEQLKEKGIGTQLHYRPLTDFVSATGDCPNAQTWKERALSLPLHVGLGTPDLKKIVAALGECHHEGASEVGDGGVTASL